MPYSSEQVEAGVFLEHAGVTIYHVYKNDELESGPEDDSFTVDEFGSYDDRWEDDVPQTFFIKQLPPPATGPSLADHPEFMGHEQATARGITYAEWQAHPDYAVLSKAWEDWHEDVKPGVIKAMLIQAIDNGWLTQEGGFDAERAKIPPKVEILGTIGHVLPAPDKMPDPGMSLVIWCIDVEKVDPIEAAREALRIHRKPDSIATVFRVVSSDGKIYDVDLSPEHA